MAPLQATAFDSVLPFLLPSCCPRGKTEPRTLGRPAFCVRSAPARLKRGTPGDLAAFSQEAVAQEELRDHATGGGSRPGSAAQRVVIRVILGSATPKVIGSWRPSSGPALAEDLRERSDKVPLQPQQLTAALDTLTERVSLADIAFDRSRQGDPYGEENAEWHLQVGYTQLLVLLEGQELFRLRAEFVRDFSAARSEGLLRAETDQDGEPHLKWGELLRRYAIALKETYVSEPSRTVTKDLESIIRATTYPLNDPDLFNAPPQDEPTLHKRIEGILRCIFTDLLSKPRLTKPIKHFEPDTGIPSIKTLIEYKYLSSPAQIGSIADEVLADTRGYNAREWTSFVYVIYETARIRPESEWRQLLRECGIDPRTTVVVLSGEGGRRSRRRQAGSGDRAGYPSRHGV